MPQATDEQRQEWGGYNGIGEDKAITYLTGRGYILTRDWEWWIPYTIHFPTPKDFGAMNFLVDEWDYGGFTFELGNSEQRYMNFKRLEIQEVINRRNE